MLWFCRYGMEPPFNVAETWLITISMILGASFYALLIAHFSGLVFSIDAPGRQYYEKVCFHFLYILQAETGKNIFFMFFHFVIAP